MFVFDYLGSSDLCFKCLTAARLWRPLGQSDNPSFPRFKR